MATVQCWTGAETKAPRQAMRLSIRAFAAHLGVDARSVNKWEARLSTITLRLDAVGLQALAIATETRSVRIMGEPKHLDNSLRKFPSSPSVANFHEAMHATFSPFELMGPTVERKVTR